MSFDFFNNPAEDAGKYLSRIPGQISQYYQPYIDAGGNAIGNLEGQYGNLMNNPGGMVNQIGQNYQQSPGFKFALQQALQGAGHAAAAGGMAGSPQHEQQNMQIGTDIANQDYYNWLQKAMGMYGMGIEGEQGLMQGGLQAGNNMASQIAQMLAQQAAYKYQGGASNNQMWGNLANTGAALAAFL